MTLSRRLALAMVMLVVVTTCVVSAFTYYFVAEAAMPRAGLDHSLAAVGRSALAGGAVAVLLAIVLAVAIARSLSRPLQQMTEAVEAFSRGEVVNMPSDGCREIAVLATAFAGMSAQQKRSYQR
jgi:nitrate/nitrite-specific signal transduction histidine kinase